VIYELDDRKPLLEGDNFVADNAAVIGSVLMKKGANVWFGCTLRGDNELITLGENVNVQDGSVIHTDMGIPVVLERNVSVGHMVMLHGCHVGENSPHRHRRHHPQPRRQSAGTASSARGRSSPRASTSPTTPSCSACPARWCAT